MRTEVIRVDPQQPAPSAITHAAAVLARGGLVVFPTETVYGLGALADDAVAAARIFEAKGRPAYNPLIVHVASVSDARSLARVWPASAEALTRSFWPGPLTVVAPRDPARVPDVITAGGPTVALRMPAHPVALALLRALGRPVAAPSANRFQQLSPTTAAHALKGLDGRVDLVLDGGPCDRGLESTVIDCTGEVAVVLRPGALPLGELRALLGDLRVRDEHHDDTASALPSPGMTRKHYAPRARLLVVRGDALADAVDTLAGKVGVVTRRPARDGLDGALVRALPDDPAGYGAGLYAALHALDDAGCDAVLVEAAPEGEAWSAVRDRLARAAG
jgi:L-threonylcarbamoyladenylate synthase